jgi:hypothetical protein
VGAFAKFIVRQNSDVDRNGGLSAQARCSVCVAMPDGSTPRPDAHAAGRGEGRLFRERLQLGLQVEGCIILVGARCWTPDFLQSCAQLAWFQDLEAFFAEPDEPEARAVGLSIGSRRAPPEVVAIPEVPLRLELLVLVAPADLIGHISGLLRERDALEGSSSACAWQAELSAYSFGLYGSSWISSQVRMLAILLSIRLLGIHAANAMRHS